MIASEGRPVEVALETELAVHRRAAELLKESVRCAVVLDTFSRRVVGWSISHNPTAALTCNALGMAIEQRDAARGTVIHSDHGTQFTAWNVHRPRAEVGAAAVHGLGR